MAEEKKKLYEAIGYSESAKLTSYSEEVCIRIFAIHCDKALLYMCVCVNWCIYFVVQLLVRGSPIEF